jgi:hypothetical protein
MKKHPVLRFGLITAILLALSTPNTTAVVVYDTLGSPESFHDTDGEFLSTVDIPLFLPTLAYKFTPTGDFTGITQWEVRAPLHYTGASPNTVRVGIWEDNATGDNPSSTGPLMYADVSAALDGILSANMSGATMTLGNDYWISFSYLSGPGDVFLHYRSDKATATSTGSEYVPTQPLFPSWIASSPAFPEAAYSINAVPEPETYAVAFSLGLIVFAGCRRFAMKGVYGGKASRLP